MASLLAVYMCAWSLGTCSFCVVLSGQPSSCFLWHWSSHPSCWNEVVSGCSGVRLTHLHCCNRYGSMALFGYPRHHRSQCFVWELGSFLCGTSMVANPCFCIVAGSLSLSARVVSLSWLVCCRGRRQCGVHSGSLTLRLCSTSSSTVMWQVTFAVAHLCLFLHHLLLRRPLLLPTFGVLVRSWDFCGTFIRLVLLYSPGVLASYGTCGLFMVSLMWVMADSRAPTIVG